MKNENLLSEFKPNCFDEWKKEAELTLKTEPYKKLIVKTYEEIDLQPIYTKKDTDNKNLSYPCFPDYRRANKLNNHWLYSQELHAKSAEDLNKKVKEFIEAGLTEVNINVDELTENGFDNFETIFKNLDFKNFSISISSKENPKKNFAKLIKFLNKEKNIVKGSLCFDPLMVFNNNSSVDTETLMSDMLAHFRFLNEDFTNLKSIGVDVSIYQEAGANAVQELSIALATTVLYAKYFIENNEDLERFFDKIKFSFSVGSNFFMEIAKFRAFRVLWSMLLKAYELDVKNISCFIHAKTSLFNKSVLDEQVNILRTSSEAFSAVMGAVDSLTILPYDYLGKTKTELAERLAKNTHIILAEECLFKDVIDPVGGSYYIETLTDELVKKAWQSFCKIDEEGGILEAIKNKTISNEVNTVYEKRKNNFQKRKDLLVGVNIYPNANDKLNKFIIDADEQGLKPKRVSKTYEFLKTFDKDKFPILQVNFNKSVNYKVRADWTSTFFELGGFKVANKQIFLMLKL